MPPVSASAYLKTSFTFWFLAVPWLWQVDKSLYMSLSGSSQVPLEC